MSGNVSKIVTEAISPNSLDLILYPTEQCNFRCTYCYEDFSIGRMTEDVQRAVKLLIRNQTRKLRQLNLAWFGGEPMVARDIMLDIARYAVECGAQSGARIGGNVTTNGYFLTPVIMSELISLGHDNFQISIDGFGEGHDRTRKLASGSGTFQKIWRNLQDLRDSDLTFKITLRIHLTRSNLASVKELLFKLADASFQADQRFTMFFKIVNQLADSSAPDPDIIPRADAHKILEQTRSLASELNLVVHRTDDFKICYASRPNSIAIRATGKIQKCTVMLNDPVNDIGTLMPDGTLEIDAKKMLPWVDGILTEDPRTLACPAGAISRARVETKHRIIPIEVA